MVRTDGNDGVRTVDQNGLTVSSMTVSSMTVSSSGDRIEHLVHLREVFSFATPHRLKPHGSPVFRFFGQTQPPLARCDLRIGIQPAGSRYCCPERRPHG